ncbi:MAG: orotidine-5'-phosphate decarboxylase [Nitrospinae bacterium]|nr:orotidine-5'-phosphate decarboxylase [Nitrospinota bacterium]
MTTSLNSKDRLIFALDVPDKNEALRLVKLLQDSVGCFKVGLELFVKEGPDILQLIKDHSSADIFLDLKLHDIPATVRGALRSAAKLGVKYITIHSTEGEAILEAAKEVKGSGLEVLAVTLLTSMGETQLHELGFEKNTKIRDIVLDRAWRAQQSGCAGVICSGEEIALVKQKCGKVFKVIVPGIRPEWSQIVSDDQNRIATPAKAIKAGADLIVVGRPIRDAEDPDKAAKKIVSEIEDCVKQ